MKMLTLTAAALLIGVAGCATSHTPARTLPPAPAASQTIGSPPPFTPVPGVEYDPQWLYEIKQREREQVE